MSTQNTFSFPKHIGRLLQVFEPAVPEEEVSGELPLYEAGGTLLNNQIPSNYRYWSQKQQPEVGVLGEEKHLNQDHDHHQLLNINAQHLANSIQLSTINSHANVFSSTITSSTSEHMLLSNPPSSHVRGFHSRIPVALETQGLSLSLSSPLQNLETTKLEELREENDGMYFTNQEGSVGASFNPHGSSNLGRSDHRHPLHEEGTVLDGHGHGQVQVGFGIRTSLETVNVLRNSKYLKAAQELLEQLCPVGRVQFKDDRLMEHHTNPNSGTVYSSDVGSSSLKEHPPLSAAGEKEYKRRKVKLLAMLDEVDTRHRNYCENMQAMVNWFDSVMGFGAAMTYTNLGRKAISRHFRCTKDAIIVQLKLTCELLGEKDVVLTGKSGLTKGETPRLRLVEQSLRQQKALHYMGMTGLEAWRPQRSLPERSVSILRAWLFEHFLHPYPSDADKYFLSRQSGLSKNQVSNWFINARVRLWKPMVEEMYQQEAKEEEDGAGKEVINSSGPNSSEDRSGNLSAQTPRRGTTTVSDPPPPPPPPPGGGKSSNVNATEKDPSVPSQNTINYRQHALGNQLMLQVTQEPDFCNWRMTVDDGCCHAGIAEIGNITAGANVASSLVAFGAPAGDVSLTLGLPHTGNVPEKSHLSVRSFGAS